MIVLEEDEKARDEDLPNFYSTVKLQDADWVVSMNDHYEKEYNMHMVSKELTSKLDENGVVTKPIQGTPWYNVLANATYVQDFAFIPTDMPEKQRKELIVDDDDQEGNDLEQSDMVALILNLGFIKENIAKEMVFKAGISTEAKKNAGYKELA